MKVLMIASWSDSYNGCGWMGALQELLADAQGVDLAIAFPVKKHTKNFSRGETIYYPVPTPSPISRKICRYLGGYLHWNREEYVDAMKSVIADFAPDVIHLFGLENVFANILGHTETPIVVHLQGLLAPYDNAYFPQGMNKSSFVWPPTFREWFLHKGYIFAKNSMHARGRWEIERFKNMRFATGRTAWDFQITKLLSPNCTYRTVNEVLRPVFYEHAGQWESHNRARMIIVSTVSQTIYKGIDLILKTAKLLHEHSQIDFEWHIIGVNATSNYVTFFERVTGIHGKDYGINYLGIKNAEELCDELLNADVYVHPSYIDNSPNSLCEAQLVGLPTIGTYVGGIPSLIEEGKSGILIPSNAPFELAYHLKDLFENRTYAEHLSEGAKRSAAKRHDRNQIAQDLIETYKFAIDKK